MDVRGAYSIDEFIRAIQSGEDVEATLVTLPLGNYETRVALRAYAYTLIALGDKPAGDAILRKIGRAG